MKKKTVGILTFHRALNYGAVLQAYALKQVCEELGCDAHIIDYDYDGGEEQAAPLPAFFAAENKKAALPGLIRGLLGWSGIKKRTQAFASFRKKYLAESAPCANAEEIAALGYDTLIAGSDQIWNRGVTRHRYDPVFFMDFETSARKILYAASSEDVPFPGEKGEAFAKALGGLQGTVSIREQKLADYVAQLTGKAYPLVLDPTLLAGGGFLDTIAIPSPPAQDYILLYQISSNPESDIAVRSLEKRFGCPVYTMTVPRLDDSHGRRGTAGPEEFLSLLKGAKFLVTNSFHGIALSLLMHKQFFVYENGGVMTRIDSLLELVGLQDRKVKLVADIDPDFDVDYASVDAHLEAARHSSMEFLRNALSADTGTPSLAGCELDNTARQTFMDFEADTSAGYKEAAGMMKKKILFSCYGLGIGGIEKCLVNLINALPEDRYDVDILLMNPEYEFRGQLRRPVRLLPMFDYVANVHETLPEIRKRGGILKNPGLFLRWCLFRLELKFGKKPWRWFRKLPEHYDVAVAYSQNDLSAYYVFDKVRADRKVFWYHNGAYERSGWQYERDSRYYPQFDYAVAVSTDCANVLRERFDFAPGRLIVLRNICDAEAIRTRADALAPGSFRKGKRHIVTVGRMTAEKGAALAVEACRMLRDRGFDICWHWVGDGSQSDAIRRTLAEYGLENRFILEGNQENPYPYIKNADIYVQPSHYEAYSTTVTEARVLGIPIVTTDVGGMRDQLTDGENGFIVPVDASAIAEAVERLLTDEALRCSFTKRLQNENFSAEKALEAYEKTVFS